MYKIRRERGPSHQRYGSIEKDTEVELSKDEFQILWLLHDRHLYYKPGLNWGEITKELAVIDNKEDPNDFISALERKVTGWIVYAPYQNVYLNSQYAKEIGEKLNECLKQETG